MRCLTGVFLVLFWLVQTHTGMAQLDGNNWYYGGKAAITFNTNPPSSLGNSAMFTGHGCATISDPCSGQLLFYTNGDSIWNANHLLMTNGTGLLGNVGSTQSAIIVPSPDTTTEDFYVFTVASDNGQGGLNYSVVDLTQSGGLGAVVAATKNTPLVSPTLEKLTAVRHRNNIDVWIITHKFNSDEFYAYLLTANGVNATPVISAVGTTYGIDDLRGYMKASAYGNRLGLALKGRKRFDLFDFNNATGRVSNPLTTSVSYNGAYGVEFSPDGSVFYGTTVDGLYQFDLSSGIAATIDGSAYLVTTSATVGIQLGPDGKIYTNEGSKLGALNSPENLGATVGYQSAAINLVSGFGNSGLPTFIQSYFSPLYINGSNLCFGLTSNFEVSDLITSDSAVWSFGDPTSGLLNSAKGLKVSHVFTTPGTYTVQVTAYKTVCGVTGTEVATLTVDILDEPIPQGYMPEDTLICPGDEVRLWLGQANSTFLWSNGSTDTAITVSQEDTYWVTMENDCGVVTDTTRIEVFESPVQVDLGEDTVICEGKEFAIRVADYFQTSYLWQNGSTSTGQRITQPGTYWVTVSDMCKTASDTLTVNELLRPVISLGSDTIVCFGTEMRLEVNSPGASYEWQDGSTKSFFTVREDGTYRVRAINECGPTVATQYVAYTDCSCNFYFPSSFTPNNDGKNDFFGPIADCQFESYELIIYNRWGSVIYSTENPVSKWDGTFSGKPSPDGSYVYKVKYKGRDNAQFKEGEHKGWIRLIR